MRDLATAIWLEASFQLNYVSNVDGDLGEIDRRVWVHDVWWMFAHT